MPDLSRSFDMLTNTDAWMQVLMVFAGFMAAEVLASALEGRGIVDLPDYVYGVGVAAAGYAYGQRTVAYGGGAHAVVQAAEEFGVRESLNNIAGGS